MRILTALLVLLFFNGYGQTPEKNIIGRWEDMSSKDKLEFTFFENGTGIFRDLKGITIQRFTYKTDFNSTLHLLTFNFTDGFR